MIPISTDLAADLQADSQNIKPNVIAHMSDMRYMQNLSVITSNYSYNKQIMDRKPQVYLKLDKTDYNVYTNTKTAVISNANPGIVTCINHGLADGTGVLISGTTTFPSNVTSGELYCKEVYYYIDSINANQFYINTSQANAIAKSATGRVNTSTTTTNKAVTIGIADPASYTEAIFTSTAHGLTNGDAITIRGSGALPTTSADNGISTVTLGSTTSTENIFYVQNASANTFYLNITKTGAINNDDTGKLKNTGSQTGINTFYPIFNFTYTYNGSHRIKDSGRIGLDVSIGSYNGSDRSVLYNDPIAPNTMQSLPITQSLEVIEPKLLIDTFNRSSTRTVSDGVLTNGSKYITSASANFTYSDVGCNITGSGLALNSVIVEYVNESTVKISKSAKTTASSVSLNIKLNSLGYFTSSDTSDKTMGYYSWRTHNNLWQLSDNKAILSGTSLDPAYITYNTTCYDHYIDVKFGNTVNGQGAVLRYIDENNYMLFYYTGTAIRLVQICDGYAATIATSSAHTLSTSNYYRFEALYNTFTVYNMGTSEPLDAPSSGGTSLLTAYVDDPIFRTASATSVGTGNYLGASNTRTITDLVTTAGSSTITSATASFTSNDVGASIAMVTGSQISANATIVSVTNSTTAVISTTSVTAGTSLNVKITRLISSIDYAAIKSFNYLNGYSNFAAGKYVYAVKEHISGTHTLNSNVTSNLEKLSGLTDFTYSFAINATSIAARGICWLGDKTSATVYIQMLATTGKIRATIFDGATSYFITSDYGVTVGNTTQVFVVKKGTKLSIYLDGLENYRDDIPTSFSPYISTSSDLHLRVGSGVNSGTSTSFFNGKIGEFAIFDYALTDDDVFAMKFSLLTAGDFGITAPVEPYDLYFNGDNLIDRFSEETFAWAVTNTLNNNGGNLTVDGHAHALGVNYILDPEYTKFNLATSTNNIQSILRDNFGWMARSQSNETGNFYATNSVKIKFDSLKCNKIFFSTGHSTGAIDTFDLSVTTDTGDLPPVSVFFEGNSILYYDLGATYNVTAISVIPTQTVNPYDYPRLYCINPIWEVDLSDYVVSFSTDKVRDNYDSSIPIGATSANSGSLVLDNTNLDFSPYGSSTYGDYIYPDTKFFISLDHKINKTQQIETVPIAYELYADNWTVSNSNMQVDVKLRDYSKYLQEENLKGYISQGLSAGRSIADILMESGFPKRKINFIDKFEETVSVDNPTVFVPFNETTSEINGQASDFKYKDYCNNVIVNAPYFLPVAGTPIVYSDLVAAQNDSQRIIDDYAYKVFIPEVKTGSAKFSSVEFFNISDETKWTPIGYNDNEPWTFSFCHYLTDVSTIASSDYQQLFCSGDVYTGECVIEFSFVDENTMYYKFTKHNVALTSYSITSNVINPKNSHLIHIKKTAGVSGANPRYDFFIDGVNQGNISPTISGSRTPLSTQFALLSTGYLSNFLYYNYALSDSRIAKHYESFSVSMMPTFKYLSAGEGTYWDAMLNIATADLGMFYFDEYGDFQYEYRNFKHETTSNRYQISQYNFSDDINISEGNINTEIQTNKVNVKVSSNSVNANNVKVLWNAPEGESLAITRITQDLNIYSDYIYLENIDQPIWPPSGYVKIDNEIIKYKGIKENKLINLERGVFGTEPATHTAYSRVREARFYSAQFTETPATIVKYPLITEEIGDYQAGNIDIDFYYSTPFETQIMLSAKDPGDPIYTEDNIKYFYKRAKGYSSVVVIQGTDPTSGSRYVFEIAGIAVTNIAAGNETVSKVSSEFENNIRKYRVKEISFENSFIENKEYGKIVADYIIGYYSNPIKVLNLSVTGVPHLQLGDLVTIDKFEQLGIVNIKFWVIQNKISYDGGLRQELVLQQYSDTINPPELAFTQNLKLGEIDWVF